MRPKAGLPAKQKGLDRPIVDPDAPFPGRIAQPLIVAKL